MAARGPCPYRAKDAEAQAVCLESVGGGVAGAPAYDGIAELWFDSVADLEKALQSPEGQEAMRDVTSHVKEVSLVITEERVVV